MDKTEQTIGELEFKVSDDEGDNILYSCRVDWGVITVLDRMTGFGYRDIETGFKDKDGKFWLASGGFCIRDFPDLTIAEAIEKIKENANTCVGYKE